MSRFGPSHTAWSNVGFRSVQIDSSPCGPIDVMPSAATSVFPYVCAALDPCFTKKRSSSRTRWVADCAQNSI
jgi:hypothetical protein